MSIDYSGFGIPKGKTRKQLKARKDREDAKQLKAFRDYVWNREGLKYDGTVSTEWNVARCQDCGAVVVRNPNMMSGEVHHIRSRRHAETRYDPNNGRLLCNHLVNNCHAKVTK
jgi:hypothetical protein